MKKKAFACILVLAALLIFALGFSVQTALADNGPSTSSDTARLVVRPQRMPISIGMPVPLLPVGPTFISNLAPGTTSATGVGAGMYQAVGFATPSTGSYSVGSARLNISVSEESCNLFAWIYSDNAGQPGSPVATFTPIPIPVGFNFDAEYDITLPTSYLLAASTTYWLVTSSDCLAWNPSWGIDYSTPPTGIFTYIGDLDNTGSGWNLPFFGGMHKWALYGPSAAVSLNPTSLDFGSQLMGTTSAAQTVTVTNTGGTDLHIGLLSFTSDWILSNDTCSNTTVIPAGTCTFDVAFHPLALGPLSGSITIPTDAPSSPDIVSLSGNGVQPAVGLSATSLEFGNVLVGTTSASQTLTLTNTGTAVLTFTVPAFQIASPFEATTDCGLTLDPGASCHFYVTFSPTALGYIATNLMIYTDAPSTPDLIPLYGTGVAIPDGVNLLKKPDFATASAFPTPWKLFGVKLPYASALDCNIFQLARCSVYFPAGNRSAMQQVNRSGSAGDMYLFGLSSMSQNAPIGGNYRVEVSFYNNFNRPMGSTSLSFSPLTHNWETISGYAIAAGNYNKIIFRFYYQNASGRAWFDDAFLMVAP